MDPAAVDPQAREARMLAAIVFTDVVGFSKLASQNESRVYVALRRDMGVMTNLCRSHGGQVLNTMGDGMLLCFTSAVDALSCAIEIQETLFNQNTSLPQVEILNHRIGVHLGDVIMNGDNVFGDGVNVASRLQGMARPGSVCFSNTVYEVVKNKLKLDAKYLGPRQLKNIGEPVRVWEVPPIDDGKLNTDTYEPTPKANPEVKREVSGWRGATMVGLSVVMVLAVIILIAVSVTRPKPKLPEPDLAGKTWATNLKTKIQNRVNELRNKNNGEKPDPTEDPIPPKPKNSGPDLASASKDFLAYHDRYAFNEMASLLSSLPATVRDQIGNLETFQKLAPLNDFMNSQVAKATYSNPIEVGRLDGKDSQSQVSAKLYGQGGRWMITTAQGQTAMSLGELTPVQYLEIADAILAKPVDGSTADPALQESYKLFSKEYRVTVP
jgi:class 3 adenylate cyclase